MFWFCKNAATSGDKDYGIRNFFQLSASLSTTLKIDVYFVLDEVLMRMEEDHGPSVRSTVGKLRIQNISEAAIDSTGLVHTAVCGEHNLTTSIHMPRPRYDGYQSVHYVFIYHSTFMLTISTVDDNDVMMDHVQTNFSELNQP